MFKRLQPDMYFDSAFSISPSFLLDKGIKAVILDIDNTLVTHKDKYPTDEAKSWINDLINNNIHVLIASNNTKKRVSIFSEALGVEYISNCLKPSKKASIKACKEFDVKPNEIAVIGDQIFTDIGCARNSGSLAILTKPINHRENAFIKFKRLLEKPIIGSFVKHNKDKCFQRSDFQ